MPIAASERHRLSEQPLGCAVSKTNLGMAVPGLLVCFNLGKKFGFGEGRAPVEGPVDLQQRGARWRGG